MCNPAGALYSYEPNVPLGTAAGGVGDAVATELVARRCAGRAAALCAAGGWPTETAAASMEISRITVRFSANAHRTDAGALLGSLGPSDMRVLRGIPGLVISTARSASVASRASPRPRQPLQRRRFHARV